MESKYKIFEIVSKRLKSIKESLYLPHVIGVGKNTGEEYIYGTKHFEYKKFRDDKDREGVKVEEKDYYLYKLIELEELKKELRSNAQFDFSSIISSINDLIDEIENHHINLNGITQLPYSLLFRKDYVRSFFYLCRILEYLEALDENNQIVDLKFDSKIYSIYKNENLKSNLFSEELLLVDFIKTINGLFKTELSYNKGRFNESRKYTYLVNHFISMFPYNKFVY